SVLRGSKAHGRRPDRVPNSVGPGTAGTRRPGAGHPLLPVDSALLSTTALSRCVAGPWAQGRYRAPVLFDQSFESGRSHERSGRRSAQRLETTHRPSATTGSGAIASLTPAPAFLGIGLGLGLGLGGHIGQCTS